mgnify:CR=1 FL=1
MPPMSNKKFRILITGGSGMIGTNISFGVKPSSKELDITNYSDIENAIKKYKPEAILHLAAFIDMKKSEEDPIQAYEVNVLGAYNIAKACRKYKIYLSYLSTCAVFNGKKASPYVESDKTDPLNVYGKTKLAGEMIINDLVKESLIIRTGWLFGVNPSEDKKFVGKTILKFKNGETVVATSDRTGSPTYIKDLVSTLEKLINQKKIGLLHVVNDGTASYLEIAKMIKKLGNFSGKLKGVKASDIEPKELKRGKMEGLSSEKIKLRSWQDALEDYVSTI